MSGCQRYKTWYFYDIDGWEHNIYGKLADCEKLAKIKYAEDNDTDYGIINVSAWPR